MGWRAGACWQIVGAVVGCHRAVLCEIGRRQAVKTFSYNTVIASLTDWQPMETAKNWCHTLILRSSSYETSSSILNHLQPVQQLTTNTGKHAVAVVQSADDEDMNKCPCRFRRIDCLIDLSWHNLRKQDRQSADTRPAMVWQNAEIIHSCFSTTPCPWWQSCQLHHLKKLNTKKHISLLTYLLPCPAAHVAITSSRRWGTVGHLARPSTECSW